jgi:hypothetical protein
LRSRRVMITPRWMFGRSIWNLPWCVPPEELAHWGSPETPPTLIIDSYQPTQANDHNLPDLPHRPNLQRLD